MNLEAFGDELMDNDYSLVAEQELLAALPELLVTRHGYKWKYSGAPATEILARYYGLGRRKETLKDIGKDYGRSVERMRQVKDRALRILRHPDNLSRITVGGRK